MDHRLPRAVLFDRDGTLIRDVPYNGDPDLVEPMPTAVQAVQLLRAHGIRIGVVTNQSGIGRGLVGAAEVEAVNARVELVFGGFDVWRVCPHHPDDGCACRKPAPGLLMDACDALGVAPEDVAMLGDIGADMAAAEAAGVRGILVPTEVTRHEEIRAAREVAATTGDAVRTLLGDRSAA
ncbi:D-glycero-alpha-D-manno-heptose-1,7-bisphosphate 7-phosphatase [Agromyces sp. GXS1127]|uniref:D-glycero-alpha-D-manno-heptose-1,7-bisphosphate 7-phosphatase n=1 Tax=Agromyces sp. GXS1127 TaxID=3424181 RepID=UPI003D30F455